MTMEENNYTFEQMRADYQALKDTLSKQEIINDKLLREAMRGKVKSIRANTIVTVISALFVILVAPGVFHYNPVIRASWWFVGATVLLMLFCIFVNWKYKHKVEDADLTSCDLITFSKDVKRLRDSNRKWVKWGMLLVVIWAGWLCTETWFHSNDSLVAIVGILALVTGLVVGGLIGMRMNKKLESVCDEILSGLEEQ